MFGCVFFFNYKRRSLACGNNFITGSGRQRFGHHLERPLEAQLDYCAFQVAFKCAFTGCSSRTKARYFWIIHAFAAHSWSQIRFGRWTTNVGTALLWVAVPPGRSKMNRQNRPSKIVLDKQNSKENFKGLRQYWQSKSPKSAGEYCLWVVRAGCLLRVEYDLVS